MGWCDYPLGIFELMVRQDRIYVPPDCPYHGRYERYINIVLNWINYKDWIQKFYYISKDRTLIPKIPRGAIPKNGLRNP